MIGLDVGTSYLVTAVETDSGISYTEFRDAFYRMKPSSPIAAKMMEKGLSQIAHFKDIDGSFVIVGQDAIEKAVERNQSVQRPLFRGVISPREPDARRVLKFILSQLVGKPDIPGTKLIYSVPGEPVDQSSEEFNTGYHEDCLRKDLSELGWDAKPLNEAEAICYSELADEDYTGVSCSMGAGMANVCVMSVGEAILKFATTRSGDWLDRMAAQSTGQPDSVIQVEKEQSKFKIGEDNSNPILSAVSAYYLRLIDYTVAQLAHHLKKSPDLPKFSSPPSIVLSGGTSLADGFLEAFIVSLNRSDIPIQVGKVRLASNQLYSVARGCLLASSLI